MEKYQLDREIKVFYIQADSFPAGVMAAWQKLHSLFPEPRERKYFGISWPEDKDAIVYKAATEENYPGEAVKYGCETFLIKKGEYTSTVIVDFMKDVQRIGAAFRELLGNPQIDPGGCCVEVYFNEKDVRCMVRLEDVKN